MPRPDASRRVAPAAALLCVLVFPCAPPGLQAATLEQRTIQAWNRYLAWADSRVERETGGAGPRFLQIDYLAGLERDDARRRLMAGEIVIREAAGVVPTGSGFDVPDGEIHHLWGAVLVPKARLAELIRFLQDYDHHAGKFADVERSRLISRTGDSFRFHFRLRRTKVVTVYFNAEQECTYRSLGPTRAASRSVATRIAEIRNAGEPGERELPPGNDNGFLWRLVSWWRFQEVPEGVIVECESASLSRDIPFFVKMLPWAASYIRSTPRESLESVLASVKANAPAPR
jgi:hypothetical protein